MAPTRTIVVGSPRLTVSLQYAMSATNSTRRCPTQPRNRSSISRANSVFLRYGDPFAAHSFLFRYSRNRSGSAQVLRDNGTGNKTARTTQQWPKQKMR